MYLRYAPDSVSVSVSDNGLTALLDAVPKKRGPKTDVLEALLKRVDGLEKRLHSEGKSDASHEDDESAIQETSDDSKSATAPMPPARPILEIAPNPAGATKQLMSPIEPRCL